MGKESHPQGRAQRLSTLDANSVVLRHTAPFGQVSFELEAGILRKLFLISIGALLLATPALAEQVWQKPVVEQCSLEPGAQCNVEVACPDTHPVVRSGGGGMPEAAPPDNQVAMTMNLPIAKDKWRVRWKNMSATESATVKVAVKVLCATE